MSWLPSFLQKLLQKIFKNREEANADAVKPFLEHLEDLRWTLIKMGLVLVLGMVISFAFVDSITTIIKAPYEAVVPNAKLLVIEVIEPFMISLKLAFYSGLVFTFPFLLYFAAEFVLPALTRQEKKVLFPSLAVGFVLFGLGAWMAYAKVLPLTLKFFYDYAVKMGADPNWQAGKYFGFVTQLTIACGLLAELPVAVLALAALGIVTGEFLRKTRTYAYLLILVLVAIVNPAPDPVTFILVTLPVWGIYELCIWIVWLVERRRPAEVADSYGD